MQFIDTTVSIVTVAVFSTFPHVDEISGITMTDTVIVTWSALVFLEFVGRDGCVDVFLRFSQGKESSFVISCVANVDADSAKGRGETPQCFGELIGLFGPFLSLPFDIFRLFGKIF